MRKVTLAATQAGDLGLDKRFNLLSDAFQPNIDLIMQEHVIPRLDLHSNLLSECNQKGTVLALTIEDVCGLSWFLLGDSSFFDELTIRSAQAAEERFSALAKSTGMYIAACYFKRADGCNFNVVSIFGPNGQILGEYRKTHVPPNEMWHVADGDKLNVIELDFGRIGALICYDMMFPEAASVLAMSGAEIILHPTGGYGWYDAIGEATLKTRANDNSVYILTAKNYVYNGAGKSSIIDPWGHALVDAGFYNNVIVSKEIDLDVSKAQPDWYYQSQMSGIPNIRQRYTQERRPELYTSLANPTSRLPIPNEAERANLVEKIRVGEARW